MILTTFGLDGYVAIAPSVMRTVVEQARAGRRVIVVPGIGDLAERERDVLEHLAAGRSNAEIAEQPYLSEATVKTHLSRILSKLGVRDRVQAVIAAFEAGIVGPRDRS